MYLAIKRESNFLSIMCSWICVIVVIVKGATVVLGPALFVTRMMLRNRSAYCYCMRMSKNRMLRRIFGSKREDVMEAGENCVMRSFMICSPHQIV
jgi:hypothetical protein